MISNVHISRVLARTPILLWVEDRLTVEYLAIIWQDDRKYFSFGIGGRRNTVIAAVNDLRSQNVRKVFGLVDRDFLKSNIDKWSDPGADIQIFRPTYNEIESFLLDWPAMAGCRENEIRNKRNENDIEERAGKFAEKMVCWMACKSVLSKYRDVLIGDFPEHPVLDKIKTLNDAEKYISQHEWFKTLPGDISSIQSSFKSDISDRYNLHEGHLSDGTWVKEFSGKEIFRHLRGYLFEEKIGTKVEMDIDLAKSIGEWQYQNGRIPQELIELKDALKARVGI